MCQALRDMMKEDFEKVEARGEDRKNRENAKGFKEAGIDPQIIASVTGLSLKDIAVM